MVKKATPTTYGLLGLLAVRSWTGYELTHQLRRSLRYIWSASEGHLYREQGRLVELEWATVVDEPAGARTRKRYTITPEGRQALEVWLGSEPEEPHFEIEGILRLRRDSPDQDIPTLSQDVFKFCYFLSIDSISSVNKYH